MQLDSIVTGMQHIGVPVANMGESMDFYKSLGFEIKYMNKEKATAFLEYKGVMVELWSTEETSGYAGAIDHISFDVTNIDNAYNEIKKQGYRMTTDSIQFLPFWERGVRFFTIVGPNEEKIEFCQKL